MPRASLLAAELMRPLLSGVFTVADDTLFAQLVRVLDALGERIEPSAAAGFSGPAMLTGTTAGQAWLRSTSSRSESASGVPPGSRVRTTPPQRGSTASAAVPGAGVGAGCGVVLAPSATGPDVALSRA